MVFNLNILSIALTIYYLLLACGWFLSSFLYCRIALLSLEWRADVKLGLVRLIEAFGKTPKVGVVYWNCRTDYTTSVFIFMFNSTEVCPEFKSYSLDLNQHAHIVELIFASKYQRCVTCVCVIVFIVYLQEQVIKWIRYVQNQASSSYFQKRISHSFFPWISDLNLTPAAAICRHFSFAEHPIFTNFVRYKIIVSINCRLESV